MNNFAPALPHGKVEEVFTDLFQVTGTYKATYGEDVWQFSRNMTVVRENGELTLINTVRLDENGLKELDSLGTVKHIVKLGASHGIDNAFYVDRYDATLWAMEDDEHESALTTDKILGKDSFPIKDVTVSLFESSSKPEAVLHVDRDQGVLITCDSIKNWSEADEFFSADSAEKMAMYGMINPVDIDKNWVSGCGIQAEDYNKLLTLNFKHLIPGHGFVARDTAYEQVQSKIEDVFSPATAEA